MSGHDKTKFPTKQAQQKHEKSLALQKSQRQYIAEVQQYFKEIYPRIQVLICCTYPFNETGDLIELYNLIFKSIRQISSPDQTIQLDIVDTSRAAPDDMQIQRFRDWLNTPNPLDRQYGPRVPNVIFGIYYPDKIMDVIGHRYRISVDPHFSLARNYDVVCFLGCDIPTTIFDQSVENVERLAQYAPNTQFIFIKKGMFINDPLKGYDFSTRFHQLFKLEMKGRSKIPVYVANTQHY